MKISDANERCATTFKMPVVASFELLSTAQGGISKLRKLVLLLATSGKLVPQASAKYGLDSTKIKWPREFPIVPEDERPFSLPSGWCFVRLGALGKWAIGAGFPTPLQGDAHKEILFSKVSDMNLPGNEREILTTVNTIDEETARKIRATAHPAGTIIFPKIGGAIATNKRRLLIRPTAIDNNCLGISPFSFCRSDYLYYLLTSIDFTAYQAGTSVPALSQGILELIPIGLPPVEEQARIVARVEELMKLCDALEENGRLETEQHARLVSTLFDTLAASESPQALTQNWQRIAQHFDLLLDRLEAVDALEQTILQLAVRGLLVQQDSTERIADVSSARSGGELPAIKDSELPFNVPANWEWKRLGSLAELINGDRSKNYPNRNEYVREGLPFINTGHIEPDGSLSMQAMNYLSRKKFDSLRSGKIQPGDLVYCLRGATIGKIAFVRPFEEGAIASSLVIIRVSASLSAEYAYLVLTSPLGRSLIKRFDNGSAQPNLAAHSVRIYVTPLPPLAEQHRIVARVKELRELCAQLRERLTSKSSTQARLAEALVASGAK